MPLVGLIYQRVKCNLRKKTYRKMLEKDLNELIKQFQENKIDPIGIREEIRSHSRKWSMKQIQDMYPNVDIAVNVKLMSYNLVSANSEVLS